MKLSGILYIGFVILILAACQQNASQVPGSVVNIPNTASGEAHAEGLPVISFKDSIHDFGKVIQGEVVSYAFKFVNTGGSDLVIANVSASCGCTATEYPRKPVKPGEEEYIKVTFNSGGREGFQKKTVTIASNTQPNTNIIAVKAMVINPEKN